MKTLLALIACTAFFTGSPVQATVYEISLSVRAGSVTGVIQTDGANGELSAADIVDWNLIINNGARSFQFIWPVKRQQFAGFGF